MKNALLNERGMIVALPAGKIIVAGKTNGKGRLKQTLIAMKLLLLLTVGACFTVNGNGFGQTINLSLHNASLEKLFAAIEQQSSYHFVYTKEELQKGRPVNIEIKNAAITDVLDRCLKDQPLGYSMKEPYIIIRLKEEIALLQTVPGPQTIISGKIINEQEEPVAGATVSFKGTAIAAVSNEKGEWQLSGEGNYTTIIITHVSYIAEEIAIRGRNTINITLQTAISNLDETLVIAYGNTTRRLNTGDIGKITAEDISKQPVSNPLATMQGRVPGLLITQSSGLNGAAFKVQLRGQNSLLQGSEPFYIIDGVPFSAGNEALNQLSNANQTSSGGISPFSLINPDDIESIEILKDADATAIYGSRGANGVIMITTKKGKIGETKAEISMSEGWSRITRTVDMLNTQQYLAMRREAFANDGIVPGPVAGTPGFAPDLFLWDTARYTDMRKFLIGGTAKTYNLQMTVSGGSKNTQFLLGVGYNKQTTVFPTNFGDSKSSVHFNINHGSSNKKFNITLSGNYSFVKNELSFSDLTNYIRLAPDIKLYDSAGNANWSDGNTTYRSMGITNPVALFQKRFTGKYNNLLANLRFQFEIIPGLALKTNIGYNFLAGDDVNVNPSTAIDPFSGALPSASFGNQQKNSWIIEPQLEYKLKAGKGKINILTGTTWQQNSNKGMTVFGENYNSDLLLNSIASAGLVTASNSYNKYRYNALFGRINYILNERYIVNLSGRRDGSSRFGPGKQLADFGSIGGAWIFSKEKFSRKLDRWLNFGKLRASYGITGNDQIGDYKYLDTWTASSTTYQGVSTLNPTALFNPVYSWESNKKWEAALELSFLKERILLSIAYFRNSCGNQLVNYTLPVQTGFNSITKNLNALIDNSGIEWQVSSEIIKTKNTNWQGSLNITSNRNKLLDFPGLATSSYANTYIIGQPLSARARYQYLGVDPASGLYQVLDVDRNGIFDKNDKIAVRTTDPKLYGGLSNTLRVKKIQLDIFLEFKKQQGFNYLNSAVVPGFKYDNEPSLVLDRWRKPGDIATIQKFTATAAATLINFNNNLLLSDGVISDASYIRVKNISLSYALPAAWITKMKMTSGKIFLHMQNVLTITHYAGADPENQNMFVLPPLKTIAAGFKAEF